MSKTTELAGRCEAPVADELRSGFVCLRGGREHNLKNVDVDVPRNALVAFTGVSGSGKSSLAFGTFYAEAQRRYFESVAPYARRLIEQVGVPDVDSIEGLPPAVALQQQRGHGTTRSSVGSVTTISNLLRMLYSRAGSYPAGQSMLYAEDFSPNTPEGACPQCHGLGRVYDATERSLVPDDTLTIRERAVAAWPPAWHGQNLRDILTTLGYDVDVPWRSLPKKVRDWILFTDEQPTVPVFAGFSLAEVRAARRHKTEPSYMGTFTSARRYVLQAFATTKSAMIKKRVAAFIVASVCPLCAGKRLKREALAVTFGGRDIAELSSLPLTELAALLGSLADVFAAVPAAGAHVSGVSRPAARRATQQRLAAGGSAHAGAWDVRRTANLSPEKQLAAERIAAEIMARTTTLESLGLGYLPPDRSTPSLSSGELQRLRLAAQLGSQLFGVVYVLDEPSAGLHPADSEALLAALQRLKMAGNTIFVVEHDLDVIRQADWLVDIGPGAGAGGGHVLYSGPPQGLASVAESVTGRHLFGRVGRAERSLRPVSKWLCLQGVVRNNLRQVDVALPIGCMIAVTGVSGSGKSTLVSQALPDLVAEALGSPASTAGDDEREESSASGDDVASPTLGRIVSGMANIRRLVCVDQKPIGRTPRSNLATYTGLFDGVRRLFAATPSARQRRFDAGRFSFNVAKGRCPTCEGEGFVSVELLFLPSVYAPCPTCHGSRYNAATLAVTWRGRTIADVLAMTVDEAAEIFVDESAVFRTLDVLRAIGLGYLRLGQPATELSGGEAQRIKLATELQRPQRGYSLYILDEPTSGLHPADADRLMTQLDELVDAGNTVVLVEHDMRVVAACDWVIDLGPGAGDRGGKIIAAGTPGEVAGSSGPTAAYLCTALDQATAAGETAVPVPRLQRSKVRTSRPSSNRERGRA